MLLPLHGVIVWEQHVPNFVSEMAMVPNSATTLDIISRI